MKFNSEKELYQYLESKLARVVPLVELRIKAQIAWRVLQLKKERNALILGHNYMEPALFFSIPDFTGDSLELSRKAAQTHHQLIVFCGVRFMAETAAILNPDKTVLLPAQEAGCSLAASITAEDIRLLKKAYPGIPVVSYINTYADVKAESDICCTSGNAKEVVMSLDSDQIIFLPDRFLAANVARETGKQILFPDPNNPGKAQIIPPNTILGWHGACEVHERFTVADIQNARRQFPDVVVLAHPECREEVCQAADYTGSTSGMVRFVQQSKATRFLLLTECSMADHVMAENPDKEIIRLCSIRCPHMNEITLEKVEHALLHNEQKIAVPEPIRSRAYQAIERMLKIGPSGTFTRT